MSLRTRVAIIKTNARPVRILRPDGTLKEEMTADAFRRRRDERPCRPHGIVLCGRCRTKQRIGR